MAGRAHAGQFGIVLQRYRVAAGLSQDQLAQQAGLSRRGIADLERGARRKPHPSTVRLLADALALSDGDRTALANAARGPDTAPAPLRAGHTRPALPIQPTSFVGRDQELADLTRLLADVRLVSLTGPGGVGKTRLAIALASVVEAEVDDGVWFVELAGLQDSARVPSAVAGVLGIQEQPGEAVLQTLVNALRSRELLLIIDNCEHLAGACAELVEAALRTGPLLRIVATSRQPLGARGETIWRVPSLRHPESVRLFVERGRFVLPSVALAEHNAAEIAEICRRLDNIPLAIELAVAWLAVLSPRQLLRRLDDQLRLLVRGDRSAPSRQQTLRATLDWSYRLLGDAERILLRRLSVFAGGWTLGAVEAIAADELLASADVLQLLAGLVDKSFVVAEVRTDTNPRYRLLEPVRQYALEQLSDAGEAEELQRHHATWYVEWAEGLAPLLHGPDQATWLDSVEADHDNLRAALGWARVHEAHSGLRLATSLGSFWEQRGHLTEGRTWLDSLLALDHERTLARATALQVLGDLLRRGDVNAGLAALEESVAIHAELGESSACALAMQHLGQALYHSRGETADARAYLEASIAMFRRLSDAAGAGWALGIYGMLLRGWGESERAEQLLFEALRLLRPSGDANRIAFVLNNLGQLARARGDYATASDYSGESLLHFRALGMRTNLIFALINNANIARVAGDLLGAAEQLREALTLANSGGMHVYQMQSLVFAGILLAVRGDADAQAARLLAATSSQTDAYLGLDPDELHDREAARELARTRLGENTFKRAWAEGQNMSLNDAVGLALVLL